MKNRNRIIQFMIAAAVSLASMTLGVTSAWPTPVLAMFHANQTDIVMTDDQTSWMVAMSPIGFIAGSFVTSYVSDHYGRRTTILSSALPVSLGTVLLLFSVNAWLIYTARFLWGWGTGMIGTVAAMYIAEIADKDLRGSLSGVTRFMFNFGTLLAISVGPFLSYRVLNICILVLPVVYFVACCWIPESPYYYLKEGKVEEAKRVLSRLRAYKDKNESDEELNLLKSSVKSDMRRGTSVIELLTGEQYRKALIIALGLKLTQIMAGVVTVQQYLGRIMQDTKSNVSLPTIFIIFGAVRFVIGIMSSVLADRVGRRSLLIYSYLGTALSHAMCGAYFFCQEVLKMDQEILSPYAYIPFVGILGSSITSTLGFTPIGFVIVGEIFPMNVKAVAMSSLSIYGGILGAIIAKAYQQLKNWTGLCGVFWIFAGIAVAGAVFSFFCVPETRGKSLRDIQILLQGDLYNEVNDIPEGESSLHATNTVKDIELCELNKKENAQV